MGAMARQSFDPVQDTGKHPVRHSIVFLDRTTLAVPLRTPGFPHDWREYAATTAAQAAERLRGATIAIINKVPLRAAMLAQLTDLKLIALAATGSDCVDKEYCRAHGITVCNIRDYATDSVPEHVLALIFALRRGLIAYDRDLRRGKWQTVDQFCYFDHPIRGIAGSVLGIVGYGTLGRALAGRARTLGMEVIATGGKPGPGLVELDELLRRSDVISLHCPLTDATRGMINAQTLALMKPDAILINTARGALIDEPALAEALRGGQIGGAGIDVLTEEPPKNGNILLDLDLPNLIVTPHIAWASLTAMERLAEQLVDNLEAFAAGTPRNVLIPAPPISP
jgi:glycerate dehydrogenase